MSIAAVLRLLKQTARVAPQVSARDVFVQAFEVGNRSAFFIAVVMTCIGVILTVQSAEQGLRMIGDLNLVGPLFLQLLVREFAPAFVGLLVAARYGAGAAAEIGTMQITEQIDALRMAGAEPVRVLVAPRVVGGILAMPALTLVTGALCYGAGGIAGNLGFGIGWFTFFSPTMLETSDIVLGIVKTAAFGGAVPLVACASGLAARGGAPGVGRSTTHAVIGGSLAVLFLDMVIGAAGQFYVMSTRV
jgi:phospholipid/cholesterol/gamma-HCH transport system permease protein